MAKLNQDKIAPRKYKPSECSTLMRDVSKLLPLVPIQENFKDGDNEEEGDDTEVENVILDK